MRKIVGIAFLLVLLSSYPVLADTIMPPIGSDIQVLNMIRFTTTGNDMGGMSVTAYSPSFGVETVTWLAGGGQTGSVSGTGWNITQTGTTFDFNWVLNTDTTITRLTFDGRGLSDGKGGYLGNTVFDRTLPSLGTDGSDEGKDFQRTSGDLSLDLVHATYINQVYVGASAPEGDIYQMLELVFTGDGFSGRMTYLADTDNAQYPVVPEPATMLLLGSGLLGLAGFARRRFKK